MIGFTQTFKIRRLTESAKKPTRGSENAAGFDIYSDECVTIPPGERRLIRTGISMSMPSNVYALIRCRSGMALKKGIVVVGGVIDPDYRGEWGVILVNLSNESVEIQKGDRISQALFHNFVSPVFEEAESLDDTNRGEGGYGSTGFN